MAVNAGRVKVSSALLERQRQIVVRVDVYRAQAAVGKIDQRIDARGVEAHTDLFGDRTNGHLLDDAALGVEQHVRSRLLGDQCLPRIAIRAAEAELAAAPYASGPGHGQHRAQPAHPLYPIQHHVSFRSVRHAQGPHRLPAARIPLHLNPHQVDAGSDALAPLVCAVPMHGVVHAVLSLGVKETAHPPAP